MHTILLVFGGLEAVLLLISICTFAWGCARHWELEILMPVGWAFYGTIVLAVGLLLTVVTHDHVHLHLS